MAIYVPLTGIPLQYMDTNGDPDSGGTLEFFIAGTSTPTNIFSDNDGTSAGDTITLNSSGFPAVGVNAIALFREVSINYKMTYTPNAGSPVITYVNLDGNSSLSSGGVQIMDVNSARANFDKPVQFQAFTNVTLPAVDTDRMIIVSNEVGGLVPAFSDGTNWRRVTDRAIVS